MGQGTRLIMIAGGNSSIYYLWKGVSDDSFFSVARTFYVSPYFGILATPFQEKDRPPRFGGFEPDRYRESLTTTQSYYDAEISTPPQASKRFNERGVRHIDAWVNKLLIKLPLIFAIKLTTRFKHVDLGVPLEDRVKILEYDKGYNTHGRCLGDSLTRFAYLIKYNPRLCIGVFTPTNLMHAWIELDGQALHENKDILCHYKKAVEYYPVWA